MSTRTVALRTGIEIVRQAIIQELLEEIKSNKKISKKRKVWIRQWISRRKTYGASNNLFLELFAEDLD